MIRTESLTVHFHSGRRGTVRAVNNVSLEIPPGETLGLVGESGSGKSTIGRCLLRLLRPSAGRIFFGDTELTALSDRAMLPLRRQIQMVFQDPFESMNPRMSVLQAIREPLVLQRVPIAQQRARVEELLKLVALKKDPLSRYRLELSGGQLQRVALARALATAPSFLVLDEPTSSLDASLRQEILELLLELQARLKVSYLFISHDLSTIRQMSAKTAVLYLGEVVEYGRTEELFRSPRHPYTKALLSAVLPLTPGKKHRKYVLSGEISSAASLPTGCFLHPRCPEAFSRCTSSHPALTSPADDPYRQARCLLVTDVVEAE